MFKMYGELAIYSGTANPELAEEIAQYLGVPLGGRDIIQFPNENLFVRLHSSVRAKDVFVIQPTGNSPVNQNIMELLIMIDTLRRDSAGRITAVVPYFAYGRTDKKDQPRVPITARLMANLITVAGADRFLTVDLHAGQITGFFDIPGDEITAFHLLSDYFVEKNLEDVVIVAPDIGASRRARNFAEKLNAPLAIVEKRRSLDGKKTAMLNLIGEVAGRNAIIFDDEIDTAGTLTQAAHFLVEKGARDIYACATHAILSPPATERLREAPLKEIVVTNTVRIPPEKRLPNMTILSIAPLLGEVIRRIHLGISVGALFNE
ncbi:MAG: ribose-phosphate pyrophosphokinase [Anaerolineae bacterium]|nr:ribose-phosphate pyrophosphokinase [Anaerolineae bacterium]